MPRFSELRLYFDAELWRCSENGSIRFELLECDLTLAPPNVLAADERLVGANAPP